MKLYYGKSETLTAAISGERRGVVEDIIQLKPCPFCGETVEIYLGAEDYFVTHDLRKSNCFLRLPQIIPKQLAKTEEEAIQVWNRRANQ